MFWTDTGLFSGFTGWWWLIPVACIVLCMISCRTSGHHAGSRGWCCGSGRRSGEIDELRKEVRELKERIGAAK